MNRLRELLARPLPVGAAVAATVVVLAAGLAIVLIGGDATPPPRAPSTGSPVVSVPGPVVGTPGRQAATLSPRQRAAATRAARRFLTGYLPYLYGKGPARAVKGVTPAVRTALAASRARATPAGTARRPRATAVAVEGQTRSSAIATVTVADGGPAPYRLSVTLELRGGRWLVSDLGND